MIPTNNSIMCDNVRATYRGELRIATVSITLQHIDDWTRVASYVHGDARVRMDGDRVVADASADGGLQDWLDASLVTYFDRLPVNARAARLEELLSATALAITTQPRGQTYRGLFVED